MLGAHNLYKSEYINKTNCPTATQPFPRVELKRSQPVKQHNKQRANTMKCDDDNEFRQWKLNPQMQKVPEPTYVDGVSSRMTLTMTNKDSDAGKL